MHTRTDGGASGTITAQLPCEQLKEIRDTEVIRNSSVLLHWSHVRPGLPARITAIEKSLRVPIIRGPSYADGVMIGGTAGRLRYAAEVKLGSLATQLTLRF